MSATQHVVPLQTGLHKNAAAIYQQLALLSRRHGMPPTVRELRAATGLSSLSVVKYHLNTLVQRGLILDAGGRSRAYRLKEPAVTPPAVTLTPMPLTAPPPFHAPRRSPVDPRPVFPVRADRGAVCRICGDPLPPFDDTPYYHPDVERTMLEETLCASHAWHTAFSRATDPILDADPVGVAG